MKRAALALYYGAISLSFGLPWLLYLARRIAVDHERPLDAVRSLRLVLFGPGENLFLIAVLNAVPFLTFALAALLHLGTAGAGVARRRLWGLAGAGLAILFLNGWLLIRYFFDPSHAALAPLALPFTTVALPLGYGLGRLAAQKVPPVSLY
ncbi:MAG: hypothetical protein HYR60_08620 [Acidobacteria bacterium]|nr:hypothetical protein [Acidobacteriota bacterium]